jgi:hypothetical protein
MLILLARLGDQARCQYGARDCGFGHGEVSQQRPRSLWNPDDPSVLAHGTKSTEKL